MEDLLVGERHEFDLALPDRLRSIIAKLKNWVSPAQKFKNAIGMAMVDQHDINIFSDYPKLSQEQDVYSKNLHTLVQSTVNSQHALVHKVKANLQMVSYMINWHMTVGVCGSFRFYVSHSLATRSMIFLSPLLPLFLLRISNSECISRTVFISSLKFSSPTREARQKGLPAFTPETNKLLEHCLHDTYVQMCFNFDAAVTISPLVLLFANAPTKLEINRQTMISVSIYFIFC